MDVREEQPVFEVAMHAEEATKIAIK